jgi:hypothetical protein
MEAVTQTDELSLQSGLAAGAGQATPFGKLRVVAEGIGFKSRPL